MAEGRQSSERYTQHSEGTAKRWHESALTPDRMAIVGTQR